MPSTIVTWGGLVELYNAVKHIYDVLEEKRTMKYVVLQKKGEGSTVVCGSKASTNFKQGRDYYMINLGCLQVDVFWLVAFLRPLKEHGHRREIHCSQGRAPDVQQSHAKCQQFNWVTMPYINLYFLERTESY